MSTHNTNANLTHDRYVSVVTPLGAKIDSDTIYFARKPRKRASRWVSRIVASFIIGMVAMVGVVQNSAPAEAGFWDPIKELICGTAESSLSIEKHDGGLRALGLGDPFLASLGYDFNSKSDWNNYRHTAYEKYGMSGTNFSAYYGALDKKSFSSDHRLEETKISGSDPRLDMWTCFPIDKIAPVELSNSFFQTTKMLTSASLWIYGQALNPGWADDIMEGAALMISGDKNITGFRDGLYFNMMGLVILSSSIYLMFLLFKRQFMNVWTNFLWVVGATAFGGALMYAPMFLPNLGQNIVTEFTTAIHNTTTGAVLGKASANKATNFCYVDGDAYKHKPRKAKVDANTMKNVRTIECSMWSVFVYSPWVAGQFGIPSSDAPYLLADTTDPKTSWFPGRTSVILGKDATISGNIPLKQIDLQSWNGHDIAFEGDGGSNKNSKSNDWLALADTMVFDHDGLSDTWTGAQGLDRLAVSTMSLISVVAGMLIIVVLSGSLLIYKIGIIMLIALSPFFLLIGAHAGFGRGIALKWLSMLAGFYLKTAFTSMFLGIAMMFYAIVTQLQASNQMSYAVGILAIIILSVGMLFYRKQLVETFTNVNIPGSSGSIGVETPNSARKVGAGLVGAGLGAVGAMGAAKAAGGAAKAAVVANPANAGLKPAALRSKKIAAAGTASTKAITKGAGRGIVSRAGGIAGMTDMAMGSRAGQAVASEHREQASAYRDQSDPTLIAKKEREAAASNERYTNDYTAMHGNEEWNEAFQQTYGIKPPNPAEYTFSGYGKQFDMATPTGRSEWERHKPKPRPKPPVTTQTPSGSPSTGSGRSSSGPIPDRRSTQQSPKPVKLPPVSEGKTMPPKFAEMNREAVVLREMEQETPPKGDAGSGTRAAWEEHQRRIGTQQKKVWHLQDSVGVGNLKRLGTVRVVSNTNRPTRPERPNL